MPTKRMTKMEAIGQLCQIKQELARELDGHVQRAKTTVDPCMPNYYKNRIDELKLQIRALEMAGTAMTR